LGICPSRFWARFWPILAVFGGLRGGQPDIDPERGATNPMIYRGHLNGGAAAKNAA
jgi:hypothetical protein